jgi:hypothetical protein
MLLKLQTSMLALFGGLALLATCMHCSQASNAPTDAGELLLDAGMDARKVRDASVDPEVDADLRDADSFDRSWLPGDWDPPPGTWPRCHLLIAQNPQRDVTPLTWQPCASGRLGCRMSVPDWDTLTLNRTAMQFSSNGAVKLDANAKPYLVYSRLYPSTFQSGTNHYMEVVQQLDGSPIYAVAQTSPGTSDCGGYTTLRSGGLTTHLLSETLTTPFSVLWSSFENPRQYVSNVKVLRSQTGNGVAGIQGSTSETALLYNADAVQWFVLNRSTGSLVRPFEGATTPPLDHARSLSDGYLARRFSGNFPIMRIWNDGHMVPLLTTRGANRFVTAYESDIAQPSQIVWIEATNLFPPNLDPVIYAAPLADSAAALTPRRVTAYADTEQTGGSRMVVANGMALIRTSGTTAELVRISDGHHWTVTSEPGMGFRDPRWVSADELWIHTGKYFPPPDNVVETNNAIMRLRIDTLGAGSPAQ